MPTLSPVRATRVFWGLAPSHVYDVVTDFEAYPRFFPEVKSARIVARDGRRVRCEFRLQLVLPVRYVLDLDCEPERLTIDWRLVEGDIVSENRGRWAFAAAGGDRGSAPAQVVASAGTRVDYEVTLSVRAPMPEFMLRRIVDGLVSLSLPAMLSALEREARSRPPRDATGSARPA